MSRTLPLSIRPGASLAPLPSGAHRSLLVGPRGVRAAACACAALGLVAGCEKSGGAGFELRGHKASEFPALGDPPRVILEGAGAGDRAPLRYRLEAGSESGMQMTMRLKMSMSLGDAAMPSMPMPGVQMNAQVSVASVEGDRARIEFVYRGTPELVDGWEGDTAVSPLVASQMQRSMAGIEGMRGHAVITDRGYTLDSDVEVGPDPDPQVSQMIQSLRQALDQLAVPWPDEPVGVGARWKVLQHVQLNGMEVYQVAAFRLEQREGDRVMLAVEVSQAAPAQTFQPPGVPDGVKARLREFASSGKGTTAIELNRLVPSSTVEIDNRMKMQIEGGGQSQDISMSMSMRVAIDPQ